MVVSGGKKAAAKRPFSAVERRRATNCFQGMRFIVAVFAAIILLFAGILIVGERYGTHRPVPGRRGPEIVCDQYQRSCSRR
jgi:hypothetical protein